MANYIIGTPEFKTKLDSWLFKSDQLSAEYLYLNKSKIPPVFQSYNKKLYRGMIVDTELIETINTKGLIFKNHTSWSKDIEIARRFSESPKYSMAAVNKAKIGIILEKVIQPTYQILDIDSFVLFMGIDQLSMMGYDETNLDSGVKEKEVLIAKNIRITKANIKLQ